MFATLKADKDAFYRPTLNEKETALNPETPVANETTASPVTTEDTMEKIAAKGTILFFRKQYYNFIFRRNSTGLAH